MTLALHDPTSFRGRCDALFFSRDDPPPPNAVDEAARAWRWRLRGLPNKPVDEISERTRDGNQLAKQLLDAEPKAAVFVGSDDVWVRMH